MRFQEILEKYKAGQATAEEQRMVEEELEKYQALTEYLLEEDFGTEEEEGLSSEEWKKIDRSFKKRNRTVILAAVVLACVIMGLIFAFQPVISKVIWYDPTEADMQEFAYDIDCHLAVLTELTMPEVQVESVLPTEQGWGKYDLQVQQRDWSTGECTWLNGTVTRGRVELNRNVYRNSSMNVFSRGTMPFVDVDGEHSVIHTPQEAKAALADLPEYVRMEAYVSLGKDWTMEELEAFQKEYDPQGYDIGWVGVRTSPEERQFLPLMGFDAGGSGYVFDQVDEAYPFYELSMHEDVPLAEAWENHFLALLQYSVDHEDFYARLNQSSSHGAICQMVQEYVRENGVMTYGFLYYGTPSELAKILEHPDVEGIYVSDARLDVPGL